MVVACRLYLARDLFTLFYCNEDKPFWKNSLYKNIFIVMVFVGVPKESLEIKGLKKSYGPLFPRYSRSKSGEGGKKGSVWSKTTKITEDSELQACRVDKSMGQCEARLYSTSASTELELEGYEVTEVTRVTGVTMAMNLFRCASISWIYVGEWVGH